MPQTIYLPFEPEYAVAPGESLAETIESLGMSQKELALRTGMTEKSINRIVKNDQPITCKTAVKLELCTGVPAEMWNNLELNYRQQLVKLDEKKRQQDNLLWLKTIPVKELIDREIIPDEKNKSKIIWHALFFFGVGSVDQYHEFWKSQSKCLAPQNGRKSKDVTGSTSSWIRAGELEAQEIDTDPFDTFVFKKAVETIRRLKEKSSTTRMQKIKTVCASAGVAVCFVPAFKKMPWRSASKWISPHKAMILLPPETNSEDVFLQSFFQEASNILFGSKKEIYLNDGNYEQSA